MKISKDWHKKFFRNSFYNPADKPALEKAPEEVSFALKKLKLKKGASVLDLCSGPGRHAVIFARKGYKVTAYDFSREYLKEAAGKARRAGLKIKTVRGDMRNLKFRNEFDAVINMFTSFGYFEKSSDDIKVLKGTNKALKKGGLMLLDVINGDFIRRNFRERSWQRLESGTWHLEESRISKDGSELVNKWIRIKPGGTVVERDFFLRLYDKRSISRALKKSGFRVIKFWGDFKGGKLSPRKKRLIVLAKKEKNTRQ